MKAKKSAAFCLILFLCSEFLAPGSAGAAEISDITETEINPVQTSDFVEDDAPYSTRLQLARMAVEFIAAEKNLSARVLADALALDCEAASDLAPTPYETNTAGAEAVLPGGLETSGQAALPELNTSSFPDTKNPYAELALRLNIMKGCDGLFRPDVPVTRAEAAVVLQRCLAVFGVTEANAAPGIFTDTYEIPRWAVEAVKFVTGRTDSQGTALMSGEAGLFSPGSKLTAEQATQAFSRMHDTRYIENVYPGWRDVPGYHTVQVTMTFGGDCTFGRGKDFSYSGSFDEMYDRMGPDYFFSGIDAFFSDDLTMVNFEGTLTNAASAAVKTFVFKGRPEYAKVLQAGSIDVVTIANNHSRDYLQQGYQDTIQNLSPYVYVSGYERMPIITVKGVKVGFASNVGWSFDASQKKFVRDAVQSLRAAGADLVVFNYHWGTEHTYHSNTTQQAIAHYCIDQGADLVIGHHPHVAQETETYKGKQIAYSLGNLVFGGNQNPADKKCLIFSETFTLDLDTRAVVSETHSALPYLISSVAGRNDYHPVPAGR